MRKHLSTIVLVILLLIGLSLLLYPTVSDYWNSFHQTRAIATYAENVAALDNASYDAIWDAARQYNRNLCQSQQQLPPLRGAEGRIRKPAGHIRSGGHGLYRDSRN